MQDDAELLRRYAEGKSEGAFTELVARHIDLVYSAALRQVGGDVHRAHDVAQCVFTTLARKAGALTAHPALPGWLYNTTLHIARRTMRSEYRRRAREAEVLRMSVMGRDDRGAADWERIRPVLDDAMRELGEREREAVVLRFFTRRAFAEIGSVLNVSEDAARMRVERALEKLQALLAKRGITSTHAALGLALSSEAVATAPAGLAASVTAAAMSGAAGAGFFGAIVGFMSATKVNVSLAAAGAVLIGFAGYQSSHARAGATAIVRLRNQQAALTARVAQLKAESKDAEQQRVEQEAALTRLRSEESEARARLAETEERKRQDKALQEFLANDSELVRLRREERTARYAANLGRFSSQERREAFVAKSLAFENANDQRRSAGLPPDPNVTGVQNFRSKIMAQQEIPRRLYYQGEPYTRAEAARLEPIFNRAAIEGDPSNHYTWFDWDRILAEAAPVVSPTRLQGLRGMAAGARDVALNLAAAREAAAAPVP